MQIHTLWRRSQQLKHIMQQIELYIGILCLATMLVTMLLNIFFRYVLYKPFFWSDELNNYLFIWMAFLSSAYVMGNDAHVRVDAILTRLPQIAQHIVKMVMDLVMLVMFVLYIYPSFRILGNLRRSNMMRIPLKYVYMIMPIAFTLMSIHVIINIFNEMVEIYNSGKKSSATELSHPKK